MAFFKAALTGPSTSRSSPSMPRPRSWTSILLAAFSLLFLIYGYKVYNLPAPDSHAFQSGARPTSPLHTGLSDSKPILDPFGVYPGEAAETYVHDPSDPQSTSPTAVVNDLSPGDDHTSSLPAAATSSSAPLSQYSPVTPLNDAVNITHDSTEWGTNEEQEDSENRFDYTTTIVVGRVDRDPDGVSWIKDLLRDITHRAIYIVDDPTAELSLDQNKGRESMVYMKYIMEHYDNLDDVTIFFHSSRSAWHNNVLFNKDGAVMINNLRRHHVMEQGYFNMRCELYPGCPHWIKFAPTKEEHRLHPERFGDLFTVKLWDQLFPNRTHDPTWLAEPCCSQFALSRDKIRSIPIEQYVRIHDWLGQTDVSDGYTGRIMEYIWQFLFAQRDEYCPSMGECYCKGYGLCLEDFSPIDRYNDLRFQLDDAMEKLGVWDKANCKAPAMVEGTDEMRECKKSNPYNYQLGQIRREKADMENNLPVRLGIMNP